MSMLTVTSPWPYFLCMLWFLGVVRFFMKGGWGKSSNLKVPLESLRGLCATGVFFYHALVVYYSFKTGKIQEPPSAFYRFLGSAGVDFFFFLSGYLFWNKCMSEGGIHHLKNFYASRARRIMPAYYVCVAVVLLVCLVRARFSLHVPPWQLGAEILCALAFFPGPINGDWQASGILLGIAWTLSLEVVFYALLPFLYRFFRGYRIVAFVPLLTLIFWKIWGVAPLNNGASGPYTIALFLIRFFAFGFGFGMLMAFLASKCPRQWMDHLRRRRYSWVPFLFLACPILLELPRHSLYQFMLLVIPFFFVVAGNDFFGLLSMRPLLVLGKISYSFYLIHCTVLYVVLHSLNHVVAVVSLTPMSYWFLVAICGTGTVGLSYFLYRTVELPYMNKASVLRQSEQK